MNAIKTFEDLQELGCSSIHESTHIARSKVDQILNKSFGEINRIQFMGFISILEREYHLNLDGLRGEYDEYVDFHPNITSAKKSAILQARSHSKKWWIVGGILFIIALIVLASKTQNSLGSSPDEDVLQLNSASVQVVEVNTSDVNVTETNTSDINASDVNISKIPTIIAVDANQSELTTSGGVYLGEIATITPVSKVWVGMMDVETRVKTQKVTNQPIKIDNTKDTLFVFGHGRLVLEGTGRSIAIGERNAVWFFCEQGRFYQISEAQFRSKNRGANW